MKSKKTEKAINTKKRIEGTVVSNKMTNAIVVSVTTKSAHPKYGKIIAKNKKFYARTDKAFEVGDTVTIEESRPLSKLIRWVVVDQKK